MSYTVVPIVFKDDDDDHLMEHVEAIAAGEPCPCAKTSTTSTGLVVVEEPDRIDPAELAKTHEYKPHINLDGPYL